MNQMIRKAFKFRLNTTPKIHRKLVDFAGGCRFVWNKALALNLARLNQKQPILWYEELNFWANLWKQSSKKDYGFLKELPAQVIQQKLKDLDKAFRDAFDKQQKNKRIPVFKCKGKSVASIRYPQGFKIDQPNNRLFLPKIGWVSYRNSRKMVGIPKNATVSRKGQYWFISIQVEYEAKILMHKATSMVGIDMGVKHFATLSNGKVYEPLNSFKRHSEKLAILQRQLKNKLKFSRNWRKQQAKVAQHHEKIANARHDYLHKISTEISENQAVIVVEDLKINNLSKSAKGKQVKQKSGLNKAILDQGWGMFVNMLDYKQNWNGGLVLKVSAHYTSQTCHCCHHVAKENRLTQAEFVCVECGYSNNADLVGAMNIETRGHRELACEVNGAVRLSAARTHPSDSTSF